MNKNKNFFNVIDSDWEDVIANTYKRANNYHVSDKKLNLDIELNTKLIKVERLDDVNYSEFYNSIDNKYSVELSYKQHTNDKRFSNIRFIISISEIGVRVGSYVTGETISVSLSDEHRLLFGNTYNEPSNISISYNLLDNFLANVEENIRLTDKDKFDELVYIVKANIENKR